MNTNDMTNLMPINGIERGVIGFTDFLNRTYIIEAKMSWRATQRQNEKLQDELYRVYKEYLEQVANDNFGYY